MPRAFDPKPGNPAVPQLVHLHARLSAKLAASIAENERTAADIGHVEAVIRLFDPVYDVRRIPGRRRNVGNPWFKRGTMFRAALDVLRKADTPMTTMEIARRIIAAKGGPKPTRDQLRKADAGLRSCLNSNEGKSVAAYMLKPEKRGSEPPHWLCPNCFAQDKKQFLCSNGQMTLRHYIYACSGCKTSLVSDGDPRWL